MVVHLEYTAVLAVKGPKSGSAVELPGNPTVSDLLAQLHVKPDHRKYVAAFVNGSQKKPSAALRDGDKVVLSLPIGGG